MVATSWTGGDGDWADAGRWSNGVPDDPTAGALIQAGGTYSITIDYDESFAAHRVLLDATGATLTVHGTLANNGTLDLKAGLLDLSGGAIQGGTLRTGGADATYDFGTLDAVHVVGPLDIAHDLDWLDVKDGFSVASASGGPGTINITGSFSTLDFVGTQSFDNATINLGSYAPYYDGDFLLNSGKLTLGAAVQVVSSSDNAIATIGGATIVNYGKIAEQAKSGLFYIDPTTFTNEGVIAVTGEAATLLAEGKSFTNGATGVIQVGPNARTTLGTAKTTFSNVGVITVAKGGELRLGGNYTVADIGVIHNHGVLDVGGVIDNQGSAIRFGTGSLTGSLLVSATIQGGVVSVAPGTDIGSANPTLDGATFQGVLELGRSPYQALTVKDGLTVTNADGTGRGLVILDGEYTQLFFEGDETFDNATIRLGDPSGDMYADDQIQLEYVKGATSATLTLGAGAVVDAETAGQTVRIDDEPLLNHTGTLVNNGTLRARAADGGFVISLDNFVNNGAIRVANGDRMFIETFGFSNSGAITVGAGSTLFFDATAGRFQNTGSITAAKGGVLDVTGTYTAASLQGVVDHGTFEVDGLLDNAGAVVRPGAGPLFGGTLELGPSGRIDGGKLVLGGGPVIWDDGDLSNIAVQGTMDLGAADARVFLLGGVTFAGRDGHGRGAIDLTGAGAILDFIGSQSVDNVTITAGASGTTDTLELFTVEVSPHTLTLGSKTTIVADAADSTVLLVGDYDDPDTVVNQGVILAGASNARFAVSLLLQNDGLVAVSNGDTFAANGLISGRGTITLAGASASVAAVAASQAVVFEDGSGVLDLTDPGDFEATVAGFRSGDSIDLEGVRANRYTLTASDELVLKQGSTTVATIQLTGSYAANAFALSADGSGDTIVKLAASGEALSHAAAAFGGESTAPMPPPVGAPVPPSTPLIAAPRA